MEDQQKCDSRPIVYLLSPKAVFSEYVESVCQAMQYTLRKYSSSEELRFNYDGMIPGCVLLAHSQFDCRTTDILRSLLLANRNAQVIISPSIWSVHEVVRAIQEGFCDFFDFTSDSGRLSTILANAIERDRILREEADFEIPQTILSALNSEEIQILRLIVQGKTTKQISSEVDLSVRTLHYRKNSIFRKLGVRDRSEAFEIIRTIRHDSQTGVTGLHLANVIQGRATFISESTVV